MKTKLSIATAVYVFLLLLAFTNSKSIEVSQNLIVSATLFFALYSLAVYTTTLI
jgi:hypothetical protein